jgi:hypothetical protein
MNDVGFVFVTDFDTYLEATEHAIANFTGTDDIDPDVVELVASLGKQAVEQAEARNYRYAIDLAEKASTFVQVDLTDLEMQDWVGELNQQFEDYSIGGFL